ncbi:MAG: Nucleoside 2-deoxyribosyltransferase [Chloroflexi bacterium]|jgi:nucleoside 2-deoxyribosyltransferase|nr:MAG: Nucleoside 2-deoxyribosyltransferase [Chloroflexota bacterium]
MDLALGAIEGMQLRPDQWVDLDVDRNYPLVFGRDGGELAYLLEALVKRGLLEDEGGLIPPAELAPVTYRLTPEGWQRLDQLRRTQTDSDQAFVAMSFDESVREAWDASIRPALVATGYRPIRMDQVEHNEKIDDRIIAEIRRCGLVVADFTEHKHGVYFEAGFALGLGIPVIWTCRSGDEKKAHFDTRQYNHILWNDVDELKQRLIDRIQATIPGRSARGGGSVL